MKKIWIIGMIIIMIVISHSTYTNHITRKSSGVLFIGSAEEGEWWEARVSIDAIMSPSEARYVANEYALVIIGNSSEIDYNITVPVIGIGYGGAKFFETWRGESISSRNLPETYLLAAIVNESLSGHPIIRNTNFTSVLSVVSNTTIWWMRNSIYVARLNDTFSSIVVSARAEYVLFGMENKEEIESLHLIDLIRDAIEWLSSRPLYHKTILFSSTRSSYIVGETMNFTVEIRDLNNWEYISGVFNIVDGNVLATFNVGHNEYRFTSPHTNIVIEADGCAPLITGITVQWKPMRITTFSINGTSSSLINSSRNVPLTVMTRVVDENDSELNVTIIYAFAPRVVNISGVLNYSVLEVSSYSHMATIFTPSVPQEWRLWAIIPARECGINITSNAPIYANYTDINIPGNAVLFAKIISPYVVKVYVESEGEPIPLLKLKICFNGEEWYQYTDQQGIAIINLNGTTGIVEIQSAVPIVKTRAVRLEIFKVYTFREFMPLILSGLEFIAIVAIVALSRKKVPL